ncbi:MAG: adenylate/guanylate cyclase domain-containing protein [Rhodospirillaceae bacterium]|nr:adenylate/guanylate cyclase domain-containing protein [Rhodospirillaceae bacterium]
MPPARCPVAALSLFSRPEVTGERREAAIHRIQGLAEWLSETAEPQLGPGALHDAFCRALKARGLPVWRSALGLEMLHPELSGTLDIWTDEEMHMDAWQRVDPHGRRIAKRPVYLNSPIRVVDDTGRMFRRRLDAPIEDMPLLEELRRQGATDYVIYPLPFIDRWRTAVLSFATTADTGFTPADLSALERAARLFSPYAERHVLRRIAIDLLDTYIGRSAGERVFEGRIERGDAETIAAAICFCDLRGFTAFSDSRPRETVIETLNAWFDCVAGAVVPHGGEILKFLGDGMLVIFPLGGDPPAACDSALEAALEAAARMETLNAERAGAGQETLDFGLALHVGEVAYGNVGSQRRLDFTVIGPAVNQASRLQELTKALGRRILLSGDFAARIRRPLVALGDHRLRDVAAPVPVFAPAP